MWVGSSLFDAGKGRARIGYKHFTFFTLYEQFWCCLWGSRTSDLSLFNVVKLILIYVSARKQNFSYFAQGNLRYICNHVKMKSRKSVCLPSLDDEETKDLT